MLNQIKIAKLYGLDGCKRDIKNSKVCLVWGQALKSK